MLKWPPHSLYIYFMQMPCTQLIEAEWHIYMPVKHANIGSDNGLLPVQCQVIIWTNAAILSIRP